MRLGGLISLNPSHFPSIKSRYSNVNTENLSTFKGCSCKANNHLARKHRLRIRERFKLQGISAKVENKHR